MTIKDLSWETDVYGSYANNAGYLKYCCRNFIFK